MKIVLHIDGRIPSKKNSRVTVKKTGRSFPSKKYSDWHKGASLQLALQKNCVARHIQLPLVKCKSIIVTLYYPDKRKADNTNKVESVHDLLVDMAILEDDSWDIVPITIQIAKYRKNKPGAKIVITGDFPYSENLP